MWMPISKVHVHNANLQHSELLTCWYSIIIIIIIIISISVHNITTSKTCSNALLYHKEGATLYLLSSRHTDNCTTHFCCIKSFKQ
jgi:hypothetical protein